MTTSGGRPAGQSGQTYEQSGGYQQQGPGYAPAPQDTRYTGQRRSGSPGAVAGTVLAGVLMIISGITGFLAGLAFVIKGSFYVNPSGYAYAWSTKNWGWVELIVGAVVFAAGVCVLLGMTWARVVGVILATLSAIASFMTIPYYPIWSIIVVAIDVFIIWALVRRGQETA
jgi:hypothetical protein